MSAINIFKGICYDYVHMNESYKTYFPLHYCKKEDLIKRKEKIDQLVFNNESIASVLETYNRSIGATENTLENISKLKEGAYAVVTGQQAGIFTGPLYTLYKAITTIKLAKQWEKDLGAPVVPIFWIASEDHDFHEIRAINYIISDHIKTAKIHQTYKNEQLLTHQKSVFLKKSVGELIVNDSYLDALAGLIDSDKSITAEFEVLETILKESIQKEETLGLSFGKIMTYLFGHYGLVFIDPMIPELRALESNFFESAINKREAIFEALSLQTSILKSNGFEPALQLESTSSQLFLYAQGERLLLKRKDDEWYVDGVCTETFTTEDIIKLVKESPERFSTNVVLRPIVQDVLFKTLAYVAGPGEMSYYAQLKGVYEVFGMEMPIIHPRENFTILPKSLNHSFEQFELQAETILIDGIESLKKKLLKEQDTLNIEELFGQLEQSIESEYRKTIQSIASLSPHLKDIQEKNLGLILRQVTYMKDKANRFHRKNHPEVMSLINEIERILIPNGGLQERFYSVFALQDVMPNQLIQALMSIETIQTEHQIIVL